MLESPLEVARVVRDTIVRRGCDAAEVDVEAPSLSLSPAPNFLK